VGGGKDPLFRRENFTGGGFLAAACHAFRPEGLREFPFFKRVLAMEVLPSIFPRLTGPGYLLTEPDLLFRDAAP